MRRYLTVCVLLIVGTLALADAPQQRKPWQWTDDERIAQRFDPVAIRARFDRAVAEGLLVSTPASDRRVGTQAADSPRIVVVGRHNPELFLPFELFPYLIQDAYIAPDAEVNRERLAPIVSQFADPREFWSKLEHAVTPYILSTRQEAVLAARLGEAITEEERNAVLREIENHQRPQCALRADALVAAAATVGRDNLYRLLYEAVAPDLNTSAQEHEVSPSRLRFAAGGCR